MRREDVQTHVGINSFQGRMETQNELYFIPVPVTMFGNDPPAKQLAIPVGTMSSEQLEMLRKLNARHNTGSTVCVSPPQIPQQNLAQNPPSNPAQSPPSNPDQPQSQQSPQG